MYGFPTSEFTPISKHGLNQHHRGFPSCTTEEQLGTLEEFVSCTKHDISQLPYLTGWGLHSRLSCNLPGLPEAFRAGHHHAGGGKVKRWLSDRLWSLCGCLEEIWKEITIAELNSSEHVGFFSSCNWRCSGMRHLSCHVVGWGQREHSTSPQWLACTAPACHRSSTQAGEAGSS